MSKETYNTSDIGIAAYLLYSGLELLGPVPTKNPSKHSLYFIDSEDRPELVEEFLSNKGSVVPKQFAKCLHKIAKELRNPVQ